jgi:hypothetical protein
VTAADKKRLSQQCLRGHPVPRSLEVLWDRHQKRDGALRKLFEIAQLLVDLNPATAS